MLAGARLVTSCLAKCCMLTKSVLYLASSGISSSSSLESALNTVANFDLAAVLTFPRFILSALAATGFLAAAAGDGLPNLLPLEKDEGGGMVGGLAVVAAIAGGGGGRCAICGGGITPKGGGGTEPKGGGGTTEAPIGGGTDPIGGGGITPPTPANEGGGGGRL